MHASSSRTWTYDRFTAAVVDIYFQGDDIPRTGWFLHRTIKAVTSSDAVIAPRWANHTTERRPPQGRKKFASMSSFKPIRAYDRPKRERNGCIMNNDLLISKMAQASLTHYCTETWSRG